jgi:hypothetical protein
MAKACRMAEMKEKEDQLQLQSLTLSMPSLCLCLLLLALTFQRLMLATGGCQLHPQLTD